MSRFGDSLNLDLATAVNNLLHIPETMEKFIFPSSRAPDHHESRGVSSIIPVDILDTPKEFIFFMDVPGLSKSEIQVPTYPHDVSSKDSSFLVCVCKYT